MITVEKALQRQITRGATRIPRDEWYHLAGDRDQWRDLARCAAWSREDDVYGALGREKRARWGDIERIRNRVLLTVLECSTRCGQWSGKYRRWTYPPTRLQQVLGTKYMVRWDAPIVRRLEALDIPRRVNVFDTRPLGTAPRSCQFRVMAPARPHRREAVDYVKHMFAMNGGPMQDPIDAFLFGPETALGAPAKKSEPEAKGKNQPKKKPTKIGRRWKGPRKK